MKIEFPTLRAEDIEVRVKKVKKNGAVALLYKTARTDMRLLDEVVTPLGWEDDYREIKGNLYCTIRIFDEENDRWVSKTDCGIESREDDEGNEKKGEASDAFKRAGFKWGIGRELYSAPKLIFLAVPTKINEYGKYELVNKLERYHVSKIEYDANRNICALEIADEKGDLVYKMGWKKPAAPPMRGEDLPHYVAKPVSAPEYTCAGCTAKITEAEHNYSTRKYGRALCRACQKNA